MLFSWSGWQKINFKWGILEEVFIFIPWNTKNEISSLFDLIIRVRILLFHLIVVWSSTVQKVVLLSGHLLANCLWKRSSNWRLAIQLCLYTLQISDFDLKRGSSTRNNGTHFVVFVFNLNWWWQEMKPFLVKCSNLNIWNCRWQGWTIFNPEPLKLFLFNLS